MESLVIGNYLAGFGGGLGVINITFDSTLLLVTGNNFLVMFVGWEGNLKCLIWLYLNLYIKNYINNKNCIESILYYVCTINNKNIISLIIGSLLGNSYIKLNKSDKSIIITFIKCSDNIEYLMSFYNYLINNGFCKLRKPKLIKIIYKKNKI